MFAALVGSGLAAQQRRQATQNAFGSETPIMQPVLLPLDVLSQLSQENNERLQACLATDGLTARELRRYFAAAQLDLDGDRRPDLLVQPGANCLGGAHAVPFWLFRRTADGHELAFSATADALRVLGTAARGRRDLEVSYATADGARTAVLRFDGSKYQPRACSVTDLRTKRTVRVKCQ